MVVGIVRIIGVLLTRAEGMILVHIVAQKIALEEVLGVGRMFVRGSGLCVWRWTALVEQRVNDDRGYAVACHWAAITVE